MTEVVINLKDLDETERACINHLCCSRYPGKDNFIYKDKFYVSFDTDKIDDELFATLDENGYEYTITDPLMVYKSVCDMIARRDMSGIYEAMDKASSSLKELSDRMAKGEIYVKPD